MHRSLFALVGLAAFVASCSPSDYERTVLAAKADAITVTCDPGDTFPMTAGTIYIQIFKGQLDYLEPSTIVATFTSDLMLDLGGSPHTPPVLPVSLSVASGASLPLEASTVDVLIDSCEFGRVDVRFLVEVVGRRRDDKTLSVIRLEKQFPVINTDPPRLVGTPQRLVETILGTEISGFDQFGLDAPTGVPTQHPNEGIDPDVPEDAFSETFQVGALVVDLTQQQLDDAFEGASPAFPVGTGPMGITVAEAFSPQPMTAGPYLLAWQCVEGNIPEASLDKFLKYELFVDRDDDPSNNFVAMSPDSFDPADNTDTWFSSQYQAGFGWFMIVSDAQVLPAVNIPSGAKVIVYGQVQLVVIPVSELGSSAEVKARFATFSHEGDFGLTGGPWSADATPRVGEPLLTIPLAPTTSLDETEAEAALRRAEWMVALGRYAEAVPLIRRAQAIRPRDHVDRYLREVERLARLPGSR